MKPAARTAPLLLGSASPRRRRLLADLGLVFGVEASAVREVHRSARARWTVRENALRKLAWCRARHPGHRVLTADTVVVFRGRCLGKPESRREADAFLRLLAGETHAVLTAVALGGPGTGAARCAVVETRVTFRPLTAAARRDYLQRVDPLDKAGAYDIDDHGDLLIARVEGSRSNVAGLPLEVVRAWLLPGEEIPAVHRAARKEAQRLRDATG